MTSDEYKKQSDKLLDQLKTLLSDLNRARVRAASAKYKLCEAQHSHFLKMGKELGSNEQTREANLFMHTRLLIQEVDEAQLAVSNLVSQVELHKHLWEQMRYLAKL